MIEKIKVEKKDGTTEDFKFEKIINAVKKSSERVSENLTDEDFNELSDIVYSKIYELRLTTIPVKIIHGIVEVSLERINNQVSKSYKDYRNYKMEYGKYLIDDIENQVKKTLYEVNRENSNSNSRYISTKRTEISQSFSKEMYQKMFLSKEVLKTIKDGYIYIHDLKDMLLPQINCQLGDVATIMSGGFEMDGVFYNEPKDIRTAVGQLGDIIMVITAQHFGGFTVAEIDKILAKYYRMTIEKYSNKYNKYGVVDFYNLAKKDAYNDLKQSLQGLEVMLNTVVSARGSYPFVTFSFGNCDDEYESDVSKAILQVRMEGHGKKDMKKNLIFPKLVFLHSENKHGEGKKFEWLFEESVKCSSKCMYPDYIGWNHFREGKFVSPMGK